MKTRNNYTQNSVKNMGISLASQMLTNILGFISRFIFIQCLSAEYLGINGLFSNVLTLLSFVELGIGEALVYAMYKPIKEGDETKLKQLTSFYKKAYLWIALFIFIVGVIISFFINFLIESKPNIPENFQIIFWLFLLNNVSSYFMAYKQSILFVDQRKYVVTTIKQLVTIGQIILQSLFLYLTHNYYIYLIWHLLGTIISNIVLSIYVDKNYKWLRNTSNESLSNDEKNKIFKNVKALSISKVAGIVSNGSDNIIIAKMHGLLPVGLVSNYSMVINALNGIVWGCLSSITGSFGQFNTSATKTKKIEVFNELYLSAFWIYSFVCVCLLVLLSPLVEVWLGKEYLLDSFTVFALVFIVYVSGLNFPFYTFRTTHGLFNEIKYNYVAYAACNVGLSILLGYYWGVMGVFAATFISRILVVELKEGKILYEKILNISYLNYFVRTGIYILLFIITYFITNYIIGLISIFGWVGLILKAIVCAIIINLIFLIVFFKTKTFKRLINRTLSVIKFKIKK